MVAVEEYDDPIAVLRAFRHGLYSCMGRRADSLFELADTILTAGHGPSPPHLSLAPVHRRGWGSLYAALSKGSIDVEALQDLLAQHPLAESGSGSTPRVYAVDQSAWPRCDAEASPGRGYYYHPSRHSAGQPIVAGWSYQLVAEIFVSTLKRELIHRHSWPSRQTVRSAIFEYIEGFYNTHRRHSALGHLSPSEYEEVRLRGGAVA